MTWLNLKRLFIARRPRVVLVTRGEYTKGGSSKYLDYICEMLQRHGYEIHTVHYSPKAGNKSRFWDNYYHIQKSENSANPLYTEPPDNEIEPVLLSFVRDLVIRLSCKIVIANKISLSVTLISLPTDILRIIVTQDVFTDRQKRIALTRGEVAEPGIPVTAEQEATALSRADMVTAITEEDQRYFVEVLKQPNVVLIPLIPRFCPLPERDPPAPGTTMKVGFFGGANRPNADAILGFISACPETVEFVLLIAGRVCVHLEGIELPGFVRLLGPQKSEQEFYQKCHLIINPDMLSSGQKVKTVEALSFGLPIICTVTAAAGLRAESSYHQAESPEACLRLIAELVREPQLLDALRQESIDLYKRFYRRYCNDRTDHLIEAIEALKIMKLQQTRKSQG